MIFCLFLFIIILMPKQLLLVDDEEFFLESLKDGLEPMSDIFETDICHSVNEAIKYVVTKSYDAVITDIRMPGKSGIELLIYLRELKFKGRVMVMSAYNTLETKKQIKSLGAVDVISKPFRLEWFKTMLLEKFTKEPPEQTVTFESIDLITVMQIINMEKKTSALEVDVDGRKGSIYFVDGEIVHAEFSGLEGEHAIMKMITLAPGNIAVKKAQEKVRRSMQVPFVQYIVDIMRIIDEIRRDRGLEPGQPLESPDYPEQQKNQNQTNTKEELQMAINEILKQLTDVKGYLGAGVFTPQGELLEGTAEISGIHFEQAGSLIHDSLSESSKMCSEIGFGKLDMLQLYTEMGIIFAVCREDGNIHFHTILVIKTDGNIAMAKLKLKKVVDALISVF